MEDEAEGERRSATAPGPHSEDLQCPAVYSWKSCPRAYDIYIYWGEPLDVVQLWHNSHCAVGQLQELTKGAAADTGSTRLPAIMAPRTYAHTRSPSSRARLRLISIMICLRVMPALRSMTFLLPPLHAAECDATSAMNRSAGSPNLPKDSCAKGTRIQRSTSNVSL